VRIYQYILIIYLGSLLFESMGAGNAWAQRVTYSGSLQYATGSYFFTESTKSIYFSNGLGISGDAGRISMNIPFVIQNSPWISYSPGGGIPTGGSQHGQVGSGGSNSSAMMQQDTMRQRRHRVEMPDPGSYRQAGFSDPSLYGSLYLYNAPLGYTSVSLNTSLKIPLANPETGFGTGAWDAGGGISVFQRIRSFFLSGDVMYWYMGDMDELDLKNPITVSVGVARTFRDGKWMASTSFFGSTGIVEDFDPPMSLGAGLGYFISSRTSLNSTITFGLSESSPDVSFGIGWSVRL